ncbi:MAG: hypothetical protein L3J41_14265 [Melioribacteraceae bacterium]|nr:hypothetical protein [Melioribacteraceae bacterium]
MKIVDANVVLRYLLKDNIELFEKYNLDFADSLLVAYFKMDKSEIITFDKKLNSILDKIEF